MCVGGYLRYSVHFAVVVKALYFVDFFDHASNAAYPAADPPVARHVAMPMEFQLSQSALLGMAASAAAIRSGDACASGPGSCGSPPLVGLLSVRRTNLCSSTRSLVAASR